MSGRKYKSGAEKRKLQLDREKKKKCAKIQTFFKLEHENENEIATNLLTSEEEGILSEENLFEGSRKSEHQENNTGDENVQSLDYQQPSDPTENYIGVQQEDGNNEAERNLENIKFEFEKYATVGLWPELLNNDFINDIISHEMTDFQNKDPKNIYSASIKKYKEQNRAFSNGYFIKKMKNGQSLERSWLCYSTRVGIVFCLTCKLFSKISSQYTTGFSDWKHIGTCLENHENSNEHKKSMLVWLTRKENTSVLDKQLQMQLKKETEYYQNVLKRVIAVVKFLSIRGLAF
ncbi:zinc finger MYM-type protein 5-like [Parasteatoda tepidariorum]|uniref:zinc finger MYM-type protein 5-like n=1 Tax=Parasteatoda tepidariorum TaxID=114398 RepID=UPI0039BC99B1